MTHSFLAQLTLFIFLWPFFPWTVKGSSGCSDSTFLGCVLRLRIQRVPFNKNVLNVVFSITSDAKLQHTCRAYSDALPCFRNKILRCGNEKQRRMLDEVGRMLAFFCSPLSMERQEAFLTHSGCIGRILQLPASTDCPSHTHSLGPRLKTCKNVCKESGEFLCMMKIWISEQSLCTLMDMEAKCGKGAGEFYTDLQQNVFDDHFPIICDEGEDLEGVEENSLPLPASPFPARLLPPPPPTSAPINSIFYTPQPRTMVYTRPPITTTDSAQVRFTRPPPRKGTPTRKPEGDGMSGSTKPWVSIISSFLGIFTTTPRTVPRYQYTTPTTAPFSTTTSSPTTKTLTTSPSTAFPQTTRRMTWDLLPNAPYSNNKFPPTTRIPEYSSAASAVYSAPPTRQLPWYLMEKKETPDNSAGFTSSIQGPDGNGRNENDLRRHRGANFATRSGSNFHPQTTGFSRWTSPAPWNFSREPKQSSETPRPRYPLVYSYTEYPRNRTAVTEALPKASRNFMRTPSSSSPGSEGSSYRRKGSVVVASPIHRLGAQSRRDESAQEFQFFPYFNGASPGWSSSVRYCFLISCVVTWHVL